MTFNEGGQFEGGRVRKGGGGRRTTAIAGGGIGAVLAALIALFFGNGGSMSGITDALTGNGSSTDQVVEDGGFVDACTGAQANVDLNCELSATVQSLDAFWTKVLPEQANVQYTMPDVVSFNGSTDTACGAATSDTGPFYCPSDQTIYVDVSFYDELVNRFGSSGGPLARKYVVAHEMGHHIQNLIGVMDQAQRSGTGAESDSVRVELMADCLAGMWAAGASTTVDPDTGVTFLKPLTENDIRDALSAASAVGDDHIQKQATGQVDPHTFTHGTSEQRMRWFSTGYQGGTLATCNTLNAGSL